MPRYTAASPSRTSTASCSPVDAPDGTAARPNAPDASRTSTSTVGFPRESRIWRAWTCAMSRHAERLLRTLVVGVLRVQVEAPPVDAFGAGELRRRLDPLGEPPRGRAKRELRVDVQPARDVDHREEDVAELVEDGGIRLGLGSRRACARDLLARARPAPRAPWRAARPDPASRSRPRPHGAAPCAPGAARASDSGTSWKIPSRPSCSVFIASQRSRTRAGVRASAPSKT